MKKTNFMKSLFATWILGAFLVPVVFSQVTPNPALPTPNDQVVLTFNAAGTELAGHTGNVFAHTGVTIAGAANPADNGRWKFVRGTWGNNTNQPQLTNIAPNIWQLTIGPSVREFYGVPANLTITEICLVIRSAAGTLQTRPDIFITLAQPGLALTITAPTAPRPIVEINQSTALAATANQALSLKLFVEGVEVAQQTSTTPATISLSHPYLAQTLGRKNFKFVATGENNQTRETTGYVFVRGPSPVAALPQGVRPGANYINDTTVTLVLHDPPAMKSNVFVIGDFNNWELTENHLMNRTPDGKFYWTTISGLKSNTEYGYQYYIDGQITIADPYTHKVLDPWHDRWIPEYNYPNLKPYPEGKTTGIVSIMHPGRPTFQWKPTNFTPPDKDDLVIYELLIRDFVDTRAIKTVMDSLDYLENLGVNVIGLMPFTEFDGNNSWGYNPAFYFATDKAYGTIDDYKRFINEAHRRGMAVTLDLVVNHSFGQSPLVHMYPGNNWWEPGPNNPWYNLFCPHPPWCWGADFNHLSIHTQEFVDRVTEFWLTEFKIDGFRIDFTKGFTNVQTANQGWEYDAVRVMLLKRMANHIWSINPDAYVILEHFAANNEERELAEYRAAEGKGMLLWGNINHQYSEASMGWHANNSSNLSWGYYGNRGWEYPHLIAYMESHDEERMMYRNQMFGNSAAAHNTRDLNTALRRLELAAAFYFTIPGPKMIWQFGELGYDYSINHCGDAHVNPIPGNYNPNDIGRCRTDLKPIRWDYFDNPNRRNVYNVFSLLANLKDDHEVFSDGQVNMDVAGAAKRINLTHSTNRVVVIGNFGVTTLAVNPNFQETGQWHEYFTGNVRNVTNPTAHLALQPGEYRLYSREPFPPHGLPLSTPEIEIPLLEDANVFPNPSATGFWFEFFANSTGKASIEVFNSIGQVVFQNNFDVSYGNNKFYWDGKAGNQNLPGMYFYKINAGNRTLSGKLIVR